MEKLKQKSDELAIEKSRVDYNYDYQLDFVNKSGYIPLEEVEHSRSRSKIYTIAIKVPLSNMNLSKFPQNRRPKSSCGLGFKEETIEFRDRQSEFATINVNSYFTENPEILPAINKLYYIWFSKKIKERIPQNDEIDVFTNESDYEAIFVISPVF